MARPDKEKIRYGNFKKPTFVMVLITYGMLPVEFLHAFSRLQLPVNSSSTLLSYKSMEIGVARCKAMQDILSMPLVPIYTLWLSDDELPNWDALVKLWMEMESSWSNGKRGWDILTSLVYLKSEPPEPVLWNKSIREVGPLIPGEDFKVGDIIEADVGDLGFGLMRNDLFERLDISHPYFKTGFVTREMSGDREAVTCFTEDCYFFDKLHKAGGRLGVNTGVRTSHLDMKSGVIY